MTPITRTDVRQPFQHQVAPAPSKHPDPREKAKNPPIRTLHGTRDHPKQPDPREKAKNPPFKHRTRDAIGLGGTVGVSRQSTEKVIGNSKDHDGPKPVGIDDTLREATRGAREIRKAFDESPGMGRKAVAAAYETANAAIRTSIASQKDLADQAAGLTGTVMKHGVKAVAAGTESVRRTTAEAASEVGSAASDFSDSHASRIADTNTAVADAWNSEDGFGRKVTASGFELLAGGVQQAVGDTLGTLNVGKEVAQGGFKVALNNPFIEAIGTSATQVGAGLWNTTERGANGAADATRSVASTGTSIANRTVSQQKDHAQKMLDGGREVLANRRDRAKEASDNITEAWSTEDDLGRKVVAAGYEVLASGAQDTFGTGIDIAKVGLGTAKASIENTVVKNGADLVAGSTNAVGSFFGGLFG